MRSSILLRQLLEHLVNVGREEVVHLRGIRFRCRYRRVLTANRPRYAEQGGPVQVWVDTEVPKSIDCAVRCSSRRVIRCVSRVILAEPWPLRVNARSRLYRVRFCRLSPRGVQQVRSPCRCRHSCGAGATIVPESSGRRAIRRTVLMRVKRIAQAGNAAAIQCFLRQRDNITSPSAQPFGALGGSPGTYGTGQNLSA